TVRGVPASVSVSHLGVNAADELAALHEHLRTRVHELNDQRLERWRQFPSPYQFVTQSLHADGRALTVPEVAPSSAWLTFPPTAPAAVTTPTGRTSITSSTTSSRCCASTSSSRSGGAGAAPSSHTSQRLLYELNSVQRCSASTDAAVARSYSDSMCARASGRR